MAVAQTPLLRNTKKGTHAPIPDRFLRLEKGVADNPTAMPAVTRARRQHQEAGERHGTLGHGAGLRALPFPGPPFPSPAMSVPLPNFTLPLPFLTEEWPEVSMHHLLLPVALHIGHVIHEQLLRERRLQVPQQLLAGLPQRRHLRGGLGVWPPKGRPLFCKVPWTSQPGSIGGAFGLCA